MATSLAAPATATCAILRTRVCKSGSFGNAVRRRHRMRILYPLRKRQFASACQVGWNVLLVGIFRVALICNARCPLPR